MKAVPYTVRNYAFSYTPDSAEQWIRISDFEWYPHQKVAFVGPSGCGKSTFLNAIAGYTPQNLITKGSINLDGARTAWVGQDSIGSFHPRMSIGDQLALVGGKEWAQKGLEQVGLPVSYATRTVYQLSGGEAARVSLAFALGTQPDILVADELCAHLDPATTVEILSILRDSDCSVILVSHSMGAARFVCDSVLSFSHNKQAHFYQNWSDYDEQS